MIRAALLFALILSLPVHAQWPDESDTTSQGGGLLGAAAASMDSTRPRLSEMDSLRLVQAAQISSGRPWYLRVRPTLGAEVDSDVSKVLVRGRLGADLPVLIGSNGTVKYTATNTSYRQQDRDQEQRDLSANLSDDFGDFARLDLRFGRNTNYDENRLTNGGKVVLDYTRSDAKLDLKGDQDLVEGFSHHWSLRADVEEVQQTNRGIANDRSLAGGGLTSAWKQEREYWLLAARYGADRRAGSRIVLDREADATSSRDTLASRLELDLGPRLGLDLKAERVAFVEERLDFARNASGVIDTASTAQKVGDERESTISRRIDVGVDARPQRRWSVGLDVGGSFSETQFVFSREGVVQRGGTTFGVESGFRYAEAGSLKVKYDFDENYNDRRTTGSTRFRGRETRRGQSVEFSLKQRMFSRSDLSASLQQSLDQNLFEELNNENDRDRLYERADVKLTSRAFPDVTVDLGGTVSRTEDVNIAASRVNNNKEDTLVEVRGGYTWDPPSGLRLVQNYRLQILFVDYFDSDDRDQFNKQGQLSTKVDYDLATGGKFAFEYAVDFRGTGRRDVDEPYRELYIRDQRRFDHRVRADVSVPYRGFRLNVGTERGFLREQRGRIDSNEDRGRISFKLTGNRKFWRRRADLRLDVERVLQFGPRVREEQKDYWDANTGITVTF